LSTMKILVKLSRARSTSEATKASKKIGNFVALTLGSTILLGEERVRGD
jgi:hypothetical protein